jgi:hypothetical protein
MDNTGLGLVQSCQRIAVFFIESADLSLTIIGDDDAW